jgi:hypothetical protein
VTIATSRIDDQPEQRLDRHRDDQRNGNGNAVGPEENHCIREKSRRCHTLLLSPCAEESASQNTERRESSATQPADHLRGLFEKGI